MDHDPDVMGAALGHREVKTNPAGGDHGTEKESVGGNTLRFVPSDLAGRVCHPVRTFSTTGRQHRTHSHVHA